MAKTRQISAMPAAELRKEREALGMTVSELAIELGVAEITVRKWENGSNPISPMVVRLLATLEVKAAAPKVVAPPRLRRRSAAVQAE